MNVVCTQDITIGGHEFKVKEIYSVTGSARKLGDYGLQTYYQYESSEGVLELPEDFFVVVGDNVSFDTKTSLESLYDRSMTANISDFKKATEEIMGIDLTPDNYRTTDEDKEEVGLPEEKSSQS